MQVVKLIFAIMIAFFFLGCNNLEQDITVELPYHESQLVVECYLEPGRKAQLLLTESSGYFDSPQLPFVNDAIVTITYKNTVDTLKVNSSFNEENVKFYNYVSSRVIPEDYHTDFYLTVSDSSGRKATAKTKLIRSLEIDSVTYKFKDSLAYVLASFHHDFNKDEYYRIVIHKDSLSNIIQNFTFPDEFSDTEKISIGTRYEFKRGSQVFISLYNLDKAYYDYLQSVEAARNANGNPFAQPSAIKSNITGGIGIFTGLGYDFEGLVIE